MRGCLHPAFLPRALPAPPTTHPHGCLRRRYVTNLLSTSFPNLRPQQVQVCVCGVCVVCVGWGPGGEGGRQGKLFAVACSGVQRRHPHFLGAHHAASL